MKDLPDILREYRVKIIPADEAAAVTSKDLGLRTKFHLFASQRGGVTMGVGD